MVLGLAYGDKMVSDFHKVYAKFGTELWFNNPSLPEIELDLDLADELR